MATAVLPKLVGHSLAMRMYVEDLSLDAHNAIASGIVDDVLSDCRTAKAYVA
jgi:enoyl-CoA hydratase/carnithine racemase